MATSRFAWGIDIGNRALKAIKLVREGGTLRIDDLDVIEHEQVLSSAGDSKDSLIQASLSTFVSRHMVKGGSFAIGVGGNAAFARFIKLPPVEAKKIPEIVRFEAIQQIPFPLEDVEWSYQLFQQPDSPDVEVGIFAMRKELVAQHIHFFSDQDMNVQVVQMNPLAVYNAMQFDKHLSETTMILDMGAENTDLIIADGETVWLRSIPIGGNNFTEALVKSFKLNFIKAEELKRNAATSKYARQIFQAMRPVFADLVAEVQRSIGFYTSTHRESRIKRIIALGSTFRLQGLQKYLQQNLQLEVERLDGFVATAPEDGRLATTLNENLISMVGAYGLAIQAMGEGKITSSLLPETIRRAKIWKEKTKWFALAASLFIVGAAVPYASLMTQKFNMDKNEAPGSGPGASPAVKVDEILTAASKNDKAWDDIENAGAADKARVTNVESMISYHDLWASIMDEIQSDLPTPQPELLSGKKEEVAKIKRSERNLILLQNIASTYFPDMSTVTNATAQAAPSLVMPNLAVVGAGGAPGGSPPAFSGGGPGGPPSVPGGANAGQRGFVVTIYCTSPQEAGFISKTLQANLRALTASKAVSEKKSFFVRDAKIVQSSQIKGPPPPPPQAPGAAPADVPPLPSEMIDPLSGESRAGDYEYVLVVELVLDPKSDPSVVAKGPVAGNTN